MANTVKLPSGATVELKDPEHLLKKDRDKVLANANGTDGILQAIALQDGVIAVSVLNWSFDLIPPSIRISSLDELNPKDYEALIKAVQPAQEYLFPDFNPGATDDPKATTANSND